jgi:catechol 2,3-dioxygenase-like lactoylglutathione lyase family enzyme
MHIRALTLETANRAMLENFYAGVLGLPSLGNGTFQIGSSRLQFFERPNSSAKYHFAINIPENQIGEAIVWLEQRTPIWLSENNKKVDFPDWNAHAVYFLDPAGNILELIARHELLNASGMSFSVESLLCISEIGLPVPNALKFAAWVEERLGISSYRAGSQTFAPLGDANGLMIAVALGREWYPQTGVFSAAHYTRLEMAGEQCSLQYLDLPYEFICSGVT